ncbi:MAG: HAD hydrolase-like protein [Rhodobacter sp.]|nr:HAD hydrolase-like protein [Paracoccaceae bacterium]MCB1408395.1 HAD hydrolase-like protein [Paracoccaceae bacterium]MCC0078989.1 HAD hydrolase-like protein [Rhodobacter sp.]
MMHPHTIKAAVFDIDGTLAMMDKETGTYTALPGAAEALAACKARGIPAVAYTNGTFFPPAHYYPLLADAGLVLEPGHILTPAAVAARALAAMGYTRIMVMGAEGTTVPVQDAGIEVIAPSKTAPRVDAVLLGWCKDFNAEQVEAVVQAVWGGARPFAGSVAPYFAGAGGKRLLGISGAIAAALTNATGVPVTVFGKPEAAGLEIVTAITGARPHEMMIVGDDPKLEIRMGRRAGALCVGVTTGVVDDAGFQAFPEDERAQIVLPSLVGFADQAFLRGQDGW